MQDSHVTSRRQLKNVQAFELAVKLWKATVGKGWYLSNLVSEFGLRLSQDAGLGVVVALPGQVAGWAIAQPHKDGGHGTLHILWASLRAYGNRCMVAQGKTLLNMMLHCREAHSLEHQDSFCATQMGQSLFVSNQGLS